MTRRINPAVHVAACRPHAQEQARRDLGPAATVLEVAARATEYLRDFDRPCKCDPAYACTYGATCTEAAVVEFTRSDRAGKRNAFACAEHAEPMAEHMARYVPGWGPVDFHAFPLDDAEPTAPEPLAQAASSTRATCARCHAPVFKQPCATTWRTARGFLCIDADPHTVA